MAIDASFVKINSELDSEHNLIFRYIDKLQNACEEHFSTEMLLFADGIATMPKDHTNIQSMIFKHQSSHAAILKSIKKLKNEIMNHIVEEDNIHFHWAKTTPRDLNIYFD